MIGVVGEIRVDHFADFERLGGDEFDNVREEVGNVSALGHGRQEPFHGVEESGEGVWVGGVEIGGFELGPDCSGTDGILEELGVAHGGEGGCQVVGKEGFRRLGDF